MDMSGASRIVLSSPLVGGGKSDIVGSSYITIRNSVFAGVDECEYGSVS